MKRPRGFLGHRRGEGGFTLVELMMVVALLGVGFGWITQLFLNTYQLWKRAFDELILQQQVRQSMAVMTKALRECKPGSATVDTPAGEPVYSTIRFTDGRNNWWVFKQSKSKLYAVHRQGAGSATDMLCSNVDAVAFLYPSFQDLTLVDVSITARKLPYARAPKAIVLQLVERVMMRNP